MPTPMTIFVGPNNSGKSKVLMEIMGFCDNGPQAYQAVLESLDFNPLERHKAEEAIEKISVSPMPGESINQGHILVGDGRRGRLQLPYEHFLMILNNPHGNIQPFCNWFVRFQTLLLDGRSRMNLVADQPGGDLQQPPQNSLAVLFHDNSKRVEVRRIIQEAFTSAFYVIDPTYLGQLRIRLSTRPPVDEIEERGVHDAAIKFHAAATPIDQTSDGVKAFTGMITEIWAGDPKIILVDEPEAFLHPTLATKLGLELSCAAITTHKQVFASTHSSTFLMGCIHSGTPLNIVRLTYRDGIATSRILPNDEILQLMRNPLLRSTGVLNGLFHEFVVITEGDSDRAFYQEINERLLRYKPDWGIPNCLFINAQNKQTIRTILKPLRKLGIPAVGIFDVDLVKDGGRDFTELLEAAGVPNRSHESLSALRRSVKDALEARGLELEVEGKTKNMSYNGGLSTLGKEDKEAANSLMNQLSEYGIFGVRNGALESWLQQLGVMSRKSEWLIQIFEAMGENPAMAEYVEPSEDDVWKFMATIKAWLVEPERKGIPE